MFISRIVAVRRIFTTATYGKGTNSLLNNFFVCGQILLTIKKMEFENILLVYLSICASEKSQFRNPRNIPNKLMDHDFLFSLAFSNDRHFSVSTSKISENGRFFTFEVK